MTKNIFKSGIFWTIIIGLAGILITILIFKYSNKERELVFVIKDGPSLIFDKKNSTPKIKLLSSDSVLIDENVYVMSIIIWNNGDLPIEKKDVRKEITVGFSDETKILDYKITNQILPDISKFRINTLNGKLIVDWDYFDPDFGFELQIIYSGSDQSELQVDGYVLGSGIKKVESRKSDKQKVILLIIISFIQSLIVYFNISELKKQIIINKYAYYRLIVFIIITVFALFLLYKELFHGYELPL